MFQVMALESNRHGIKFLFCDQLSDLGKITKLLKSSFPSVGRDNNASYIVELW